MSFDPFAFARAVRDCGGLSYMAKSVAVVSLLSRRNTMTGVCNPSAECIKADTGFKDARTIQKAIAELIGCGFVSVEKIKGKSNAYSLHVPACDAVPTQEVATCDVPTCHVPTSDVGRVPTCDAGTPPTWDVGQINQRNKPKNKKEEKAHRLDIESLPYEWFVDCVDLQPELDAYKLFDEFSDYWANVEGKKGMKLDWRKTWKNYLRNLPTWKHANYVREGGLVWDGKPWRRPVDPDSSLGRYYAMQEDAIKQSKAEDELLAYAETRLKNFGLINHDPF